MTDPLAPVLAALTRPGRPSSDYDLNPGTVLPEGRRLRAAGVLVAFEETPDGARLWLTKRSSQLRHHPGQIAFPGGKVESGDLSPVFAALREAQEEIGLPPEKVEILGTMEPHETVTGFEVTPVIGRIRAPFIPRPEPGEVEEAFTVPLSHITAAHFRVERRRWRGDWRHYYVAPYGPYYIWGATARILRALCARMEP
ncbi:CoA pyrophosphatase [Paenirhodobacter sp.]|uniref:CoA pyrophosphatase n=1 Tax=Paenirhodobacter sp. TaxID=1965326 RepID=UPI003B3E09AE